MEGEPEGFMGVHKRYGQLNFPLLYVCQESVYAWRDVFYCHGLNLHDVSTMGDYTTVGWFYAKQRDAKTKQWLWSRWVCSPMQLRWKDSPMHLLFVRLSERLLICCLQLGLHLRQYRHVVLVLHAELACGTRQQEARHRVVRESYPCPA